MTPWECRARCQVGLAKPLVGVRRVPGVRRTSASRVGPRVPDQRLQHRRYALRTRWGVTDARRTLTGSGTVVHKRRVKPGVYDGQRPMMVTQAVTCVSEGLKDRTVPKNNEGTAVVSYLVLRARRPSSIRRGFRRGLKSSLPMSPNWSHQLRSTIRAARQRSRSTTTRGRQYQR